MKAIIEAFEEELERVLNIDDEYGDGFELEVPDAVAILTALKAGQAQSQMATSEQPTKLTAQEAQQLFVELAALRTQLARTQSHIVQIGQTKLCCPRCGSENGALGTSNAYWVCAGKCREETGHSEQYWADSGDWIDKVMASPWGRPAHLAEEIKRLRTQLEQTQLDASNGRDAIFVIAAEIADERDKYRKLEARETALREAVEGVLSRWDAVHRVEPANNAEAGMREGIRLCAEEMRRALSGEQGNRL